MLLIELGQCVIRQRNKLLVVISLDGGLSIGKPIGQTPLIFISMKRKEPIAVISTDKHLQENNAIELFEIAEQEIALAKELGVKYIFWLGDIFDSRISQRQDLLTCLSLMIEMYSEEGLEIHCIPGNHDKTDYSSDESFLTQYKYHPGFILHETPTSIEICGVDCHFLPFYTQEVWLNKFSELPPSKGKRSVLLSHTAVQGSINNDGKEVQNNIPLSLFKGYGKVLLGHYHNAQQPGANVFHLPSTKQNNFGEDEDKGFTILYDDLSIERVCSHFKPFREVKVDVLTTSRADIIKLAKEAPEGINFRVTLIGDTQSIKGVDKKVFTSKGISVKTKYTEVEVPEDAEAVNVVSELTGTDIASKFEAFCNEKNYDYSEGYPLLAEIMKWEQK